MELPVGYRFMPTDEELVVHYLMKKASCSPLPTDQAVREMDANEIYEKHPKFSVRWSCGEKEWYFFIQEDENSHGVGKETIQLVGDEMGFWKSIGEERAIYDNKGQVFAFKTNLTYYSGNPSKSRKTHWKMDLYRLPVEFYTQHSKGEKWVLGRVKRGIDFNGCF